MLKKALIAGVRSGRITAKLNGNILSPAAHKRLANNPSWAVRIVYSLPS